MIRRTGLSRSGHRKLLTTLRVWISGNIMPINSVLNATGILLHFKLKYLCWDQVAHQFGQSRTAEKLPSLLPLRLRTVLCLLISLWKIGEIVITSVGLDWTRKKENIKEKFMGQADGSWKVILGQKCLFHFNECSENQFTIKK